MRRKLIHQVLSALIDPYPHRTLAIRLAKKYQLGSYVQRLRIGAVDRPHYGYCAYQAAKLALKLGIEQISLIEFGVAGGNGLVNFEYHVREIEKTIPIKIQLYGFDTGKGLPAPKDYRDLPHRFRETEFRMDIPSLISRLERSILVLGDVEKTVVSFFEEYRPPPIAAISFDLDYYSSTKAAFKIFESAHPGRDFLPRVFCYFDDVIGTETELYNDFVGERLAIHEFNQSHQTMKISPAYHLLKHKVQQKWHHRIFIFHDFSHPRYNDFVGEPDGNDLTLEEK